MTDAVSFDSRKLGVQKTPQHPLPPVQNEDELAVLRLLKQVPSLNDLVESVFKKLMLDQQLGTQFRHFLQAVVDDEAVEGTCSADNYSAARMVRDYANEHAIVELAEYKLGALSKSLSVVARRYGFGRKQRRYTVAGEYVQPDTANGRDAE